MDLPFDLDYVIRKAGLRREGYNGASSLVLAARDMGYPAYLIKRTSRMEARARLGGGLRYVKEQDQFAMQICGKLVSLHLDTDWQQLLERFHRNVGWRGDQRMEPGPALDTFDSYYFTPDLIVDYNDLERWGNDTKRKLAGKLIKQTQGNTPLARRHTPWRGTRGMLDVTQDPPGESDGTIYPGSQALENLNLIEGYQSLQATMDKALSLMIEPGQATLRPFTMLGDADNPRVVEGFRPAIQCLSTGQQLVLGPEGSWCGLCEAEQTRLGKGLRIFMGQDIVMTTQPMNKYIPEVEAWDQEVKRFALMQTSLSSSPAGTRPSTARRKI